MPTQRYGRCGLCKVLVPLHGYEKHFKKRHPALLKRINRTLKGK